MSSYGRAARKAVNAQQQLNQVPNAIQTKYTKLFNRHGPTKPTKKNNGNRRNNSPRHEPLPKPTLPKATNGTHPTQKHTHEPRPLQRQHNQPRLPTNINRGTPPNTNRHPRIHQVYHHTQGHQLRNKTLRLTNNEQFYNTKDIPLHRQQPNKPHLPLPTRRPRQPTRPTKLHNPRPTTLRHLQNATHSKQVFPQFSTQPYTTSHGTTTKRQQSSSPRDLRRAMQRNEHPTKMHPRHKRNPTKHRTTRQPTLNYFRPNTNNKTNHTKQSHLHKTNPHPRHNTTTPTNLQPTNSKTTNIK